jgi:asparagine synthase (glutamine-hydrolysing)
MCGIAGCVVSARSGVEAGWLRAMSDAMRHRGPDDEGWLQWSPSDGAPQPSRALDDRPASVGFAHLRLAIIDLTEGGWQPRCTPDGRWSMVFNGEIYNYLELRTELEELGHTFTSESDSEVLLAAFVEWGVAGLYRLVGMFAFAVLDVQERRLTLVRDFFGIKPLYLATWPGGLGFASEIKALLSLPTVSLRPSAQAVLDYLEHGAVDHGVQTMFADVRRVPPAHVATVSLDRPDNVELRRYWSLPAQQTHELSFGEATDRVRAVFLENLALHLRSDVPVGTALSGGVDSSAIVAGLRAIGGPALDIRAFSYVADDPLINEERWLDLAGSAASARITKVTPSPEDLVADLDELIHAQDEPFGSTSIYAQHRVFRLAAENGVKVMLDGQGADELLAGYRPYLSARIAGMLRGGDLRGARRLADRAAALPGAPSSRRLLSVAAASLLPTSAVSGLKRRTTSGRSAQRWLDRDWFADHGALNRHPVDRATTLRAALGRDLETSSLPGLLRYEDRNSMAFSIESRVPFLTPAMAELVLGLPEEHLLAADGTTKSVFKAAMRGIVPDPILDRRDKIGFATPEQQWLQAMKAWVDTTLGEADPARVPGLRLDAVRQEWQRVVEGRTPFGWQVWRWLNLIRWTEIMGVERSS